MIQSILFVLSSTRHVRRAFLANTIGTWTSCRKLGAANPSTLYILLFADEARFTLLKDLNVEKLYDRA